MPLAPDTRPTGTIETPAMRGKRLRADDWGARGDCPQLALPGVWPAAGAGVVARPIGYLASRPTLVPVYIEVETASGSARVLTSGEYTYGLRQESVKKELREFVEVLRRVSPDKHLMQQQWKGLFQKVTPHAYRTLSLYAQESTRWRSRASGGWTSSGCWRRPSRPTTSAGWRPRTTRTAPSRSGPPTAAFLPGSGARQDSPSVSTTSGPTPLGLCWTRGSGVKSHDTTLAPAPAPAGRHQV